MNTRLMIEIFGYIGSFLVVTSMLMSSVIRLRVINTIGSIVSATYALIIGSYPLALMNICLIVINLYHLLRLRNTKNHYSLIEGKAGDSYLKYLLDYYREDIANYFPTFSSGSLSDSGNRIFSVCCDQEVAGVMIGKVVGDELNVCLDYATPVYRDCSVGAYMYERLPEFGINGLLCSSESEKHSEYLKSMGFQKEGAGKYHKRLKKT